MYSPTSMTGPFAVIRLISPNINVTLDTYYLGDFPPPRFTLFNLTADPATVVSFEASVSRELLSTGNWDSAEKRRSRSSKNSEREEGSRCWKRNLFSYIFFFVSPHRKRSWYRMDRCDDRSSASWSHCDERCAACCWLNVHFRLSRTFKWSTRSMHPVLS